MKCPNCGKDLYSLRLLWLTPYSSYSCKYCKSKITILKSNSVLWIFFFIIILNFTYLLDKYIEYKYFFPIAMIFSVSVLLLFYLKFKKLK